METGRRRLSGIIGGAVSARLALRGHRLTLVVQAGGRYFEACRRHRIKHLLYASSSVYGGNAKVPFSEDDRTDEPVPLYGATKKADALMACFSSDTAKLQAWMGYKPSTSLASGLTHFRDWYNQGSSIRPA